LLGPQETGFNNTWTTHVICGSVLELNKERERERERKNTNEKDISQTKKERRRSRKAKDGCFPLSKGKRN
jgi:hypothetical protein